MKRVLFLILGISLILTSCSLITSDNVIADQTFEKLVKAINTNDDSAIKQLFSMSTYDEVGSLEDQIDAFLRFIEGDIVNYSNASDAGVGVDEKFEFGKKKKVLQSSFRLETTAHTYYIAIIECRTDTFDSSNVGVTSVYIINAQDWAEGYIFRGEKVKVSGIHIIDQSTN